MSEHTSGRNAIEAPIGRTHVAPRSNDSLWYKAKVFAPMAALLSLAITATWFFTSYDKRITVLEVSSAQQEIQVKTNTESIAGIQRWVPTVDLKLFLLLDHFGIKLPPEAAVSK